MSECTGNNMQELKVYNSLASAIAGRAVTVWELPDLTHACTDGTKVFLPARGPGTDVQASVITQALLLRDGDLSLSMMIRIAGRALLTQRYFITEFYRVVQVNRARLPQLFLDKMGVDWLPCTSATGQESLDLARSSAELPEIPRFMGQLKPRLLIRNLSRTSAQDSVPTTKNDGALAEKTSRGPPDDADDRNSSMLSKFYNPLRKGRSLTEILGLQSKTSRLNPFSTPGAQGLITRGNQRLPPNNLLETSNWHSGKYEPGEQLGSQVARHPEWNFRTRFYRAEWVTINEENSPVESVPVRLNEDQFTHPPQSLRRAVAGIGLSHESHPRESYGDELSLDALIQYITDSASGCTPDDRVYFRQMKTRRDLAVLTLLDISGSATDRDTEGNSIHSIQTRLAYHITRALHEFGDSVALYAYNSFGRHDVRFLRIKSFSENRIDSVMHRKLEALAPEGYTRSGAALRHAALKLRRETRMPHCLMILITDGFAYDLDYEQRYAEEDTRMAIEEIRAVGVGCLCLSIAPIQQDKKLQHMYGAATTLSVRDYGQFLSRIRPALKSAIQQIRQT